MSYVTYVTSAVLQAGQVVNSETFLRITVTYLQMHTNVVLFKIVSTFQAVRAKNCSCSMAQWKDIRLGWRMRERGMKEQGSSRSDRKSSEPETGQC